MRKNNMISDILMELGTFLVVIGLFKLVISFIMIRREKEKLRERKQ